VKNCDQFRDLMEACALGALDPEERANVEAHLATGCPECARAVEEARWLVSQLAYTAPEAAPSDMLKGRLMHKVRAEAQTHSLAKPHALPQKPAIPIWLWAAVAALLIFSVYSAWNARHLENEIREANKRYAVLIEKGRESQEQLAIAKREAMIMMDPASHKIALWGKDSHPEQLEAKWHAQMGLCVMGDKVPMPSANHVLQVWFIPKDKNAKPMPSMMVRPDSNGKLMFVVMDPPQPMDATKSIAITEEPAGGSHWPTSAPIWSGDVT
jgi:anti-sigma-K factor RskA